MSSTSNAQDLLVNVFRPTYRWDSTTGFTPSLVVSNVTELIAGSIKADRLAVSDSNLNTYIGSNAGANAVGTASNVALGYSAMGGALNSSNNVAVGMFSLDGLSTSDSNVALGAATDITGRGRQNVLIGPNVTMGDGSGNILIGVDISAGNLSKRFQLGRLLYADLSFGYLGVNTTAPTRSFDVSGITVFRGKVGFQNDNPVYSLDVDATGELLLVGARGAHNVPRDPLVGHLEVAEGGVGRARPLPHVDDVLVAERDVVARVRDRGGDEEGDGETSGGAADLARGAVDDVGGGGVGGGDAVLVDEEDVGGRGTGRGRRGGAHFAGRQGLAGARPVQPPRWLAVARLGAAPF